jgi:gliding motility-associated-like protein
MIRTITQIFRKGFTASLILFVIAGATTAQTPIFVETFGTNTGPCDQGTLANGFVTSNGTWTVTSLGINDSAANEWYISATEPGLTAGSCANPGCHVNALYTDRTLHVGNVSNSPNAITGVICPTGDCGAVYDPGGFQIAVQTNKRAESPFFSIPAQTPTVLVFNYIENGDSPGDTDNVTVEFFNGSVWVPSVSDAPRTTPCSGNSVLWQTHIVPLPVLPAAANVKIGFTWLNNNFGFGTSPSFAVDSIVVLSQIVAQANITVSDTDICVNDCIDFFADSSGPLATYSWTFAGSSTPFSSLQNPTGICYPNPGTYPAQLIVSALGSPDDTANITIVVNPCVLPTADFVASDSVFCERNSITFTDLSTDGPTGWLWTFPGGVPATSSLPAPHPIYYATPGFYDVTLIVFNQYGADTLTKTAYLDVQVCPFPIADFNSTVTQTCPQKCVSFTDNSSFGPILTYNWYFPGAVPDTSTAPNPTVCYSQEGLYDVRLIVTNQYGSDTIIKYSEVNVQFVPNAFASPDTSMFFGSSYQLNAGGGGSYLWSPATGLDDPAIANPIASPGQSTVYTVEITDAGGCIAYRQVVITILHNNNVFIPNTFSPNGDGRNDYLFVRGNNVYGLRFTIFDRWGAMVFETTSQSIGWDGTYKGEDVDPGVFTYVVTINYSDKQSTTTTGTVTMIR